MAKRGLRTKGSSKFNVEIRKLVRELGAPRKLSWVRTGIHALDLMLGNGVPLGRIIEIFGDESTGKSLLSWEIARAFQRKGGIVVCFDVEATTPKKFIKRLGVDFKKVIYKRPRNFEELEEEFFRIHARLRNVSADIPILYIHDTIAATTSLSEWEYDKKLKMLMPKKKTPMGIQARAMSSFMKHIAPIIAEGNNTYLAINQIREKIGVMFGDKTTTPGGRALRFYSGIRLRLNRGRKIENKRQRAIGTICNAWVQKNKCSEPFRKAPLRIIWKSGIDRFGGICEVLEEADRIKKGKAGRYSMGKLKFRPKDMETILKKQKKLLKALW